jgi:hypothetical protein
MKKKVKVKAKVIRIQNMIRIVNLMKDQVKMKLMKMTIKIDYNFSNNF